MPHGNWGGAQALVVLHGDLGAERRRASSDEAPMQLPFVSVLLLCVWLPLVVFALPLLSWLPLLYVAFQLLQQPLLLVLPWPWQQQRL